MELLKSEGWQYFQLSGHYSDYGTHRAAHALFAAKVEGIIQPSVEVYVSQLVAQEKGAKEKKDYEPAG